MKKIQLYIKSMRLRTLPLSMAGVLLGLMLAAADYIVRWPVVIFTLLTTVSLQLLSNVSNELGDFRHGTGPKCMIAFCILCCAVFGLLLIHSSFGTFFSLESILLELLGIGAISGAMRYTLGKHPYGYVGLGDLYVFIFFGIVSVLGAYFVAAHEIRIWYLLLPAVSMGAFSVAVLNVNNMRDVASDAATRRTVPIIIGVRRAKIYHTVLVVAGWGAMIAYSALRYFDLWHYLYLITLPLFVVHLVGVWKKEGKALDPMLPLLVISVFLFALTAGLGWIVFLF